MEERATTSSHHQPRWSNSDWITAMSTATCTKSSRVQSPQGPPLPGSRERSNWLLVDNIKRFKLSQTKASDNSIPYSVLTGRSSVSPIIKVSFSQNTVEHIQTMFPLFWRQKEVLKLLNEEQRKHHQELKTPKRKQRTGEPGDIIIVWKQVQSNAPEGIPAKLVLRTKRPYRVLEKVLIDSYQLQKIPGTTTMDQGL